MGSSKGNYPKSSQSITNAMVFRLPANHIDRSTQSPLTSLP